jgi:hypothetical protein
MLFISYDIFSLIWVVILAHLISHYRPILLNNFFKILFLSFPLGLLASLLGECLTWLIMGSEYRPSATIPETMHWVGAAFIMSGTYILCSFVALLVYRYKIKRKEKVTKVREYLIQLDAGEVELIENALGKYENIEIESAHNNLALEERISAIPTEEIIERLDSRMFSEDAIPSVLRVLNRRLVNNNSKP